MITPINKVSNIRGNNELYIKRDDLYPLSLGGNKARKAEIFFEDIKKSKCDSVITYGSSSSNHCRVVANMCEMNSLDCYIVTPEGNTVTMNSTLVGLTSAKVIETHISTVSSTISNLEEHLMEKGKSVYVIEGGGHGNLGTQAYVNCFSEIIDYETNTEIEFDMIFLPSGTGTTQAGLVCGAEISERSNLDIIGISIARDSVRGREIINLSISEYFTSHGYMIKQPKVNFYDDWICGGYGMYNLEILNSIKVNYLKTGIAMDSTYTGKAFYGMMNYIEKFNIRNKKILFLHTGGTPLFFDIVEEL